MQAAQYLDHLNSKCGTDVVVESPSKLTVAEILVTPTITPPSAIDYRQNIVAVNDTTLYSYMYCNSSGQVSTEHQIAERPIHVDTCTCTYMYALCTQKYTCICSQPCELWFK